VAEVNKPALILQSADQLLAQVHGTYQAALEAVARGNDTYHSVLNTKKSLQSL